MTGRQLGLREMFVRGRMQPGLLKQQLDILESLIFLLTGRQAIFLHHQRIYHQMGSEQVDTICATLRLSNRS